MLTRVERIWRHACLLSGSMWLTMGWRNRHSFFGLFEPLGMDTGVFVVVLAACYRGKGMMWTTKRSIFFCVSNH